MRNLTRRVFDRHSSNSTANGSDFEKRSRLLCLLQPFSSKRVYFVSGVSKRAEPSLSRKNTATVPGPE